MPSLKAQFKNIYKGQYKQGYGTKKHEASDSEKQQSIYSSTTRDTYIQQSSRFVDYLKSQNLRAATVEDARQYVPNWLESQIAEGKSAWTVKTQAAAMAKAYGCKSTDFDVDLPVRSCADIKRGRHETNYDKHFNEENHSDLAAFCRSTGLRRIGVEGLTGQMIREDGKGNYVIDLPGPLAKGGRPRSILVYYKDPEVLEKAKQVIEKHIGSSEKIFGPVTKAADIHSYRAEYAKSLYDKYARDTDELATKEKYICRGSNAGKVYDRAALDKVTQGLGHNRLDVTVSNYLNK